MHESYYDEQHGDLSSAGTPSSYLEHSHPIWVLYFRQPVFSCRPLAAKNPPLKHFKITAKKYSLFHRFL